MSLFIPLQRTTFLVPSGSNADPERKHLFVLLNNPVLFEKKEVVLIISVSSIKQNLPYDNTCILKKGEHSFIQHDSYVIYSNRTII